MNDKQVTYNVLTGNHGWVLQECTDYATAKKEYDDYVAIAQSDAFLRTSDEGQVSLWASNDHDPIETYEPPITYRVLVGEIGMVALECSDYDAAKEKYDYYVEESKHDSDAWGYQERVELWASDNDGDPREWYEPEETPETPELNVPGHGETIAAILVSEKDTDGKIVESKYCYDCMCQRMSTMKQDGTSYHPKNQAQFVDDIESFQHATGIVHEFFTTKWDELYSDNWYNLLGKVCDDCKVPLGYWHVCKFCGVVEFPGDDTHVCMEFVDAGKADKRTKAYRLYDSVLNGFDDSWIESGFTEDVL